MAQLVFTPFEEIPRGWLENYNAGTDADFYVDAATGNDSNAGTSVGAAKATIAAAMTAAAAAGTNQTIAIRAGDYREAISPTSSHAGLTLKGYGTEKPRIWGGRSLTGWTQCSASDEPELGSVLGVSDSPVWKVTVASSSIVHPAALCLYEGDTFVPICQQQTTDLKWYSYYPYYETSDSITKNGSNQLLTITDTSVLSGLTSTRLVGRAFAYVQGFPNVIATVGITAFNGSDTITVDGLRGVSTATTVAWNLANYLPKLTQGSYGYIDNGDSTITIYCYPNNAANLTANMTCAERSTLFTMNTVSGVRLIGLQLEQVGTSANAATGPRLVGVNQSNGTEISGFEMRHCRIRRAHSGINITGGDLRQAGTRFWRTNNLVATRCTFEDFFECFGMYPDGTDLSGGGDGARISQNTFRNIALAAVRAFKQTDIRVTFNDLIGVGRGGHANLSNFYISSDRVLWFGNRVRDTYAYLTWQNASRLVIAMNDMEGSKLDGRVIVDQNGTLDIPVFPCESYIFHNLVLPNPLSLSDDGSITVGQAYNTARASDDQPTNHGYYLFNNVIHGGGVQEPYRSYSSPLTNWRDQPGFDDTVTEPGREGNVYTELEFWQSGTWAARASEAVQTTLSSVYENAAGEDWRAVAGSPILTHTPASVETIISECETLFPGFNFRRDATGRTFSPSAPARIGPYQGTFNTQVEWDA